MEGFRVMMMTQDCDDAERVMRWASWLLPLQNIGSCRRGIACTKDTLVSNYCDLEAYVHQAPFMPDKDLSTHENLHWQLLQPHLRTVQ